MGQQGPDKLLSSVRDAKVHGTRPSSIWHVHDPSHQYYMVLPREPHSYLNREAVTCQGRHATARRWARWHGQKGWTIPSREHLQLRMDGSFRVQEFPWAFSSHTTAYVADMAPVPKPCYRLPP